MKDLCPRCEIHQSVCGCMTYILEEWQERQDDWPYRYDPAYEVKDWELMIMLFDKYQDLVKT